MDDEMLRSLVDMNVNTWCMNSNITKGDLGWGSHNFHRMGRAKIALIKQFLDLGVAVVISDIDTAWLKNPLPYFARFPTADILTSTGVGRGVNGCGEGCGQGFGGAVLCALPDRQHPDIHRCGEGARGGMWGGCGDGCGEGV